MIWKRLLSGNLAASLFCVAAVVVNQSVFRLGALPLAWSVLFVAAVAFVAVTAPDIRLSSMSRERLQGLNVLLGAVIVAPLIVTLALGWDRDFPFSGDHYFHVGQTYRMAFWWLNPPGSAVVRVPTLDDVQALLRQPFSLVLSRIVILLLLAVGTSLIYRRNRLAALLFAVVALVGWGLCEQTIFLRYPGGGYVAALPFLAPAYALHNVELAGRIANVAAPIVWLFALRPWLVGRWPDWRIVPFAVLLFWQQDVIYYFDSVYLEPWSIVFCLLAVELLIAQGSAGAPLACLLIGTAATVKEAVILALPLVWLAGAPWRKSWSEFFALSGCAFAAGAAFLLYYVARNDVAAAVPIEAGRGFRFALPSLPLMEIAQEFAHRMLASFSLAGAVLFLAAVAMLIVMIWRFPARRLQIACLAAAGAGLVLFFLVDEGSFDWIGYFRFFLLALPFLVAGALAWTYALGRQAILIAGAVTLVVQAPSAANAIARAAGPITGLNFVEAYDAAIFFPMKSLIAEARSKGLLPAGDTVFSSAPDTSLRAIPGIPVTYGPPGSAVCECSPEHPAVMALYVRYVNLAAPSAPPATLPRRFAPPEEREQLWRVAAAERPMCLARLQRTCAHVLQRVEGGELVAALGTAR